MIRFRPVVLGLIFLMLAAPLTGMISHHTLTLSEHNIQSAEGWDADKDVPTWRIGDEWVYETKFDVAQLIAQANVSASLNTLTGDTTYTVTDIYSPPPMAPRHSFTKLKSMVISPRGTVEQP